MFRFGIEYTLCSWGAVSTRCLAGQANYTIYLQLSPKPRYDYGLPYSYALFIGHGYAYGYAPSILYETATITILPRLKYEIRIQGAVLLTVGRACVGNDVTLNVIR